MRKFFTARLLQPGTTVRGVLFWHFMRQLLSSSTAGAETFLVRALAGIAAPMLVAAFWIVTLAHDLRPWSTAGIHALFVWYSFCAMGCVTTLCWDRLLPERLDFLVLLPMPLRGRSIFAAKLGAVAVFLGLFLVAANAFSTLLLPALAGVHVLQAMAAHAAAVFGAGAASTLAVLACESLVVALVPERWLRYAVPCLQTVLVAGFLTAFLQVLAVMDALPRLLSGGGAAQGFAPLWFLSVYEVCLGGTTATPLAHALAWCAVMCLPFCCAQPCCCTQQHGRSEGAWRWKAHAAHAWKTEGSGASARIGRCCARRTRVPCSTLLARHSRA